MTFSNFCFRSCLSKKHRPKMALAAGVLMVLAGVMRAQTLTDLGATAPTPGAEDIAQLSTTGNRPAPDGLHYFTDSQTGYNAGEPGQTFTTGINTAGYALTSVSFMTCGQHAYSGIGTPQPYYLHIYSVSGGNVTLLQTYTSAYFTFNDSDWLQWSGLSVPLAPNTTYAWSFGKASSTAGFEAMGDASGNPYAGGEIGLFPPAGGTIAFGGSHGFDAVFDVGLVLATQPSINQLTVSPTNNVFVGTPVAFTASVLGAQSFYFQWQFDNGGGFTDIPGANTNTLAFAAAVTNIGSYQLVLTNSFGTATSSVAILNVTASAPILVSDITPNFALAYPGGSMTFSAVFIGSLPISYQWQADTGGGATNIPDATNSSLTLGNLQPVNSGSYTLLASNSIGVPVSTSAAQLTVLPLPAFASAVMQDNPVGYWRLNETNSTAGGNLTAVDMTGNYNGVYDSAAADGIAGPEPASGFLGFEPPNTAAQFTNGGTNSFVTIPPLNLNTNTVTITAWIYPVGTPGNYCGLAFCRSGGDASGLGFTSNGQLGYTWNQNNPNTWRWNSFLFPPLNQWSFVALVISPASAIIYLCNTNGVQYATNAIAHTAEAFNATMLIGGDTADGGNGDRTFNGIMDEVAVFNTSLNQNQVLNLYFNGVAVPPQATAPAASPSTNLFVGDSVVLSELALGVFPFQYQWETNGVVLPGATNNSLALANLTLADSGNYCVIISDSLGVATSAPVTLSVTLDTTPPTALRAVNIGVTNVEVDFSKEIEAASATNVANYMLTNGVAISGASLATNGATVILTTAPLVYGSNYMLVINGVRDQAIPPNTIATNTLAGFTASAYTPQDIGNPPVLSSVTVVSNGLTVAAAGNDIGGSADQFNFEYQACTGDFDVSVRMAGLSPSDVWAKAGLMARETLDAGSRFAASIATPAMNGCFFEWRDPAGSASSSSGNYPANYPNIWLRLQRAGNTFTGFAGYDGQTWAQLGSVSISMSNHVYLGFAVSSHNTNQPATAQFVNYETTPTNAVVGTVVNPHEPLGPSSRKTGIVFSEIMWKPAPRTDGNNVEFIEIYNSNPWFHDLSGYQIVCADMNYTFPPNTIIPGGAYFVIAASPQGIQNVYGLTTSVFGPYNGSLKKSETLQLIDEQGAVLLTVPYSNVYPWPVAAEGTGHSIVLANPSYGEGDPRAWDISDVVGGSPGQMEAFHPSPLRSVVINEFLAHTDPPDYDYIELYNHSTNAVDLSGCILTDDPATNKFVIPPGTIIPARGFVFYSETNMNFALNAAGESIYFINPGQTRILDAVQFGAQQNGVATGRWPDGANDFYRLSAKTPGSGNAPILTSDIVINELMYDPISGKDDDQYIELYNKGTNTINLAGWQLTSGVTFTFPSVTLAPNGYLVVARNLTNLFARYSNLNSGNTVGNYSGKLSHNGEYLALTLPAEHKTTDNSGHTVTNIINIVVNDLTYGTGGRWGEWSAGGGSSLELIDPNSNNRLAANWADSDETQKSAWTNIECTGVLDNGANFDPSIDYAQIGLLDAGECLVDNIEVDDTNGINYVSNPDFETGTDGWSFQGCMVRSSLENSGYQSAYSLHIRCSDRLWTGVNSCQVALNTNSLTIGQTATLRFKARWLHGWPEPLLRLNGNWLEATATMPVPANLGSPGLPNSRYVTNAGPAIYNVTHNPTVPAANQPVVVTANVSDPDGVQNLTLYYRLDPETSYTAVPMKDDGNGGDAIAGDGIYSATIPGQATNQIAAFYISATDSNSTATRFPALRPQDNEPVRECVVMFGDGNPGGSFGVYHLWITQTNVTRWASLSDLSNEMIDGTFVNNNRVIYNMQGRFAGSPYHQVFDTASGSLCHYKWEFNDDDMFLGATDFNKIHQPGNIAGDDASLQREECANTFLRALRVPWLYKRLVAVYVNGNRRGTLMEDTQVPAGDMVKEYFPNDTDGYLYKMQPWFEFAPFPTGSTIAYLNNNTWCTLNNYTTTGGAKKAARYRYSYEIRRTADSDNDFAPVYSLVDAANSYGTPNYVANMENMANMENWMRVFAANHAAANIDSFGATMEQNIYGYIGTLGTKYALMMFDFNFVLDHGGWGPGQNLFTVFSGDPYTADIYSNPTFQRMYWRALQELVNGPLTLANTAPLCNAKYSAFVANGLSVEDPNASILPWIALAGTSIASQLAAVDASSFTVTSVTTNNNVAYVTGTAPVNVNTVWINGVAYPLTWTTLTNWTITMPLVNGTNQLSVVGVDKNGQPITGDSNSVSVVCVGTNSPPAGQVVINEIMYAPAVNNAQFVELYNNSTNATFDLSGWQLQGLAYTFPNGSLLGPTNYLVLAANGAAFAEAYGATNPVFDTFSGILSPNGETLTLNNASDMAVARVKYENQLPWPTNASGTGASLQLMDPHQDIWRAGNWSVTPFSATPDKLNSAATTLVTFPSLWINELQADNLTGITNSAGQHAAWLELYNPGTNILSLNGLYLANNYTNLLQWAFPTNAVINAGQFKVIFADGLTNLSTTNELHASFILPGGAGSLALTRLATNGQQQVLDYVNYPNINPNDSYGSFPDGQSFNRQEFFQTTPGAPNNGTATPPPSFIDYDVPGSVYTQNFDSLPDPGATSVNTDNTVTINGVTYSLANPYDFAFPVIASGSSGGVGISALAGWYGTSALLSRFGATDGDQTTGGQLSFGLPNSSNRALGLLATSTTGGTAFGVRFINGTAMTLTRMNLQFTGEVWRQSDKSKTLQFYYFIDHTGNAAFPGAATAYLPGLNVSFPTVGADSGGVAVDGASPLNQTNRSVLNQTITNWPPDAALWLVWQMTDSTGKAQGLGIDNLSFSASIPMSMPVNIQTSGTNFFLNWSGAAGQTYQLEYKNNLTDPAWTPLGSPVTGTGGVLTPTHNLTLTNNFGASTRRFFRLRLVN
jgi:regulation of enolase protein 1 (concanavalin A-like superfamily)